MKGLINKLVLLLGGTALVTSGGCYPYRDLVDPCYPERYRYEARQNVRAAFAQQVRNGHVLDQTVWNYHFESGTDQLTPGGQEHLVYLGRRRPHPDPVVFLQTAQDVTKVDERAVLDQKRIVAIQQYLASTTAGRIPGVPFQVVIHDPPVPGQSAVPVDISLRQMYSGAQGTLPGGGGGSTTGGAGGAR